MFSFLRAAAGDPDPSSPPMIFPRGFDANMRCIATHSTRANPREQEEQIVSPAFGNELYLKLARYLQSDMLEHRWKSIVECISLFESSMLHVSSALSHGLIDVIFQSMRDSDDEIRRAAQLALAVAFRHGGARVYALERADIFFSLLTESILDSMDDIRIATFDTCRSLAVEESLILEMKNKGVIQIAVDVCTRNNVVPESRGALLLCVSCLSEPSVRTFLSSFGMVRICHSILQNFDPNAWNASSPVASHENDLFSAALHCLHLLCFDDSCKEQAVEDGAMSIASRVLSVSIFYDPELSEHASGVLMSTSIVNAGKHCAEEESILVSLLSSCEICDPSLYRSTLINCLRALCNLSENPPCRARMRENLQAIERLCSCSDESLKKVAQKAIQCIIWNP